MSRGPICAHCDRQVIPCAPCCRHTGWRHKHDDGHLCDPKDPTGTMAFPVTGTPLILTKPAWA
jgi:hypothetical protein